MLPQQSGVVAGQVSLNREPFLAHQLRLLARAGYRRVVLCVGYRAEQIREFAGDGRAFGVEIEYSPDGPQLLGTFSLAASFTVERGARHFNASEVFEHRTGLLDGHLAGQ